MYIQYKTEGWGVNHRAQMQSDNIKRTSTLPRGAVTMITKWKWPTLLLQWLSEKVGERKGRQTDSGKMKEGGGNRETRYSIVGGRLGIFDCEAETELHIIIQAS